MGEQVAAGFLSKESGKRVAGDHTCTLKIAYRKRYNIFNTKDTRHPRKNVSKALRQRSRRYTVHENEQKPREPTLITLYERKNWLSLKERRVDALALRADERRDKLRKASGRGKYPLIRRSLNGET